MITQVASNVNSIFNIETIKRNRILTDRTCKGVLQQTNLVFININVGKHILQDSIQDVARLQEMIDTRRVLSLYNIFLTLRTFAIDMLGNRLPSTRTLTIILSSSFQYMFLINNLIVFRNKLFTNILLN